MLQNSLLDKSKTCIYRGNSSLDTRVLIWQLFDLQISMGFTDMHITSVIGPYSHMQSRHVS